MAYTETVTHRDASLPPEHFEIDKTHLGFFSSKGKLRPTAIVIHHTCTKSPASTRRTLRSKACSTHFEVGVDGHIYQYLYLDERASHCGSANCHCIGIDVTHMKDAPWPDIQVRAVRWLVHHLCEQLNIPLEIHKQLSGVYPHKAIGSTECPQDFPMERLAED